MNSRLRILNYIATHEAVTAAEISRALHLTKANVRHHLAILLGEGAIRASGVRRQFGRGRPTTLYSTEKWASRHNLEKLAHALLTELLNSANNHKTAALNNLANRLALPASKTVANPIHILNETINHLNQMNYQARWEAHAISPRIIFQHCPYLELVEDHPELCQMDKLILEKCLGKRVDLVERLSLSVTGKRHCLFQIIR